MKITHMVFKLQIGYKYMTEITIHNFQRAVTPKVGKTSVFVLLYCTLSHVAELCDMKIAYKVFKLPSGHKYVHDRNY